MTRGDAITLIRELIDDRGANRWTTASLGLLATMTLDSLYGELLDVAPNWQRAVETVSPTSPGYVDLSADLTNRWYRFFRNGIVRESQIYSPAKSSLISLDDTGTTVLAAPSYTYVVWGGQLWLFDLDATNDVDITYSFKPTSWADLADDNTEVIWPDGHEDAYIFEIASRCLMKGAAEDWTGMSSKATAGLSRAKAWVKKWFPGPDVVEYHDNPGDWGSIE